MSKSGFSRTAYILLWFPKPSETFVFSEVKNLFEAGVPLFVYTLYGKLEKNLSTDMLSYKGQVFRLGVRWSILLPIFILYWGAKAPRTTVSLLVTILFRRWRGLEKTAENGWACLSAFYLAYRFQQDKIEHIHAPWACGCATAAWVASRLTSIPFSFTMRAWDIYPPDSLICEKTDDALLIRSETQYNIDFLQKYTGARADKFYLTYNGVPMEHVAPRVVPLHPPYQLLAVGRLVGKKGYTFLLDACALLQQERIAFHLHIVGDGPLERELKDQCSKLGLDERLTFHGFCPYEAVPDFFRKSDIFMMPCVIDASGDRDGIPTVIMESLLHHVPVITTPVSGIPELIENRVTGLLVPEKNPQAIADAVCELIDKPQEARKMAEQGNQKVRQLFNAKKNHKKVLEIYEHCLSR